jgi:hypothetical protein
MANYKNLSECERRGYDIAVDELDSVIETRVEERLECITEDLEAKIRDEYDEKLHNARG